MTGSRADLLLALIAVFLWSSVASAFKIALLGMTPLNLLLVASWVSCLALAVLITAERGWDTFFKQTRKDWIHSLGLGFLNPFLYYQLLFNAYRILPGQVAQPLNYSWPILFSLLAVPLLGKVVTRQLLLGLGISFFGVVWLASQGRAASTEGSSIAGCLYALGSAAAWALFWILNIQDRRPPLQKLLASFLPGTILVTGAFLKFEQVWFPDITSFVAAVYIGLFEMGVTFVIWLRALEISERKHLITNLAYLSPFISLFFLHWVVGEPIGLSSVSGLILVVAGILIQSGVRMIQQAPEGKEFKVK